MLLQHTRVFVSSHFSISSILIPTCMGFEKLAKVVVLNRKRTKFNYVSRKYSILHPWGLDTPGLR